LSVYTSFHTSLVGLNGERELVSLQLRCRTLGSVSVCPFVCERQVSHSRNHVGRRCSGCMGSTCKLIVFDAVRAWNDGDSGLYSAARINHVSDEVAWFYTNKAFTTNSLIMGLYTSPNRSRSYRTYSLIVLLLPSENCCPFIFEQNFRQMIQLTVQTIVGESKSAKIILHKVAWVTR
jgi:hypothetical protein